MESGTAGTSTAVNGASTGANGAAPASEQIEVLNPANGEVAGAVDVATPEQVAETVARVRANQAEWEALGNQGRYMWLGKLRDWLSTIRTGSWRRCRRRPARSGPRRPTSRPTWPT